MAPDRLWFEVNEIEKLDSPALIVFPSRVKRNIETAISMVGDVSLLRPHAKTNKSPDVARLMLDAGIKKFKCATIAEAEMLGQCGAPDVLLSYQPIGPKVHRFIAVIKKYPATSYSCLVDNAAAAEFMAAAFAAAGITVNVFLDLNIGQNRTGIVPGAAAAELYKLCSQLKGMRILGLHAYDGHMRASDLAERTAQCEAAFAPVRSMQEKLIAEGFPLPIIVAGGSPSFPIHAKRGNVECSPGTFVYWDKGYSDLCPEQDFLPAAVLVSRVISLPSNSKICIDLGHKSVSAENEITRRVFFPQAPGLVPLGQSEEHLVLEAEEGHAFHIGDVLYGIPFHVCPTVALYERAITIEDGAVTGEWMNEARDRRIGC